MYDRQTTNETKDQAPEQFCSSLTVASMPWVFTQRHPLDTSDFIREAERRGCDLDLSALRELYRHGLLVPFVAIHDRRVGQPVQIEETEPSRPGTRLIELRLARNTGRVQDLATIPFRSRLPFERSGQPSNSWWNGLLYSWYQLLMLPPTTPVGAATS